MGHVRRELHAEERATGNRSRAVYGTYKRAGNSWQSLLYHRDIEPFDTDGRYVKQLTVVAALPAPFAPAQSPKDDLADYIGKIWRNWNSHNLDSILSQGSLGGIGFGWRTRDSRTSQFPGISPEDLAKSSGEVLRARLRRSFASWDHYHVEVTDLHTKVEGDIGLAWGTYDESFKPKDGAPEEARVRFTETYKRDGSTWRSLLYHRDIEPFDGQGRYVKQLTARSSK